MSKQKDQKMKPSKSSAVHLTHCRCGSEIKGGRCPKEGKYRELAVYHDVIAQHYNANIKNSTSYGDYWWTVVAEGNQFRAYAGDEPSPSLFETERKAWLELEKVYFGLKEWPEPEDEAETECDDDQKEA